MEKKTTRPQNAPNPANNFLQEDFFSKIRGHLVHVYLNNNQDFWATVVGVDVYTVLFAVKDGNGKIIENFLIWKSALAGIKVRAGEVDFQTVRPKNKRIVSPRGYGSNQDLTKTSEKTTETSTSEQTQGTENIEIRETQTKQEESTPNPTMDEKVEIAEIAKEPEEKAVSTETVKEPEAPEEEKTEPVDNDVSEKPDEENKEKGNSDINNIMTIFGID